jgi:hypothetical protein
LSSSKGAKGKICLSPEYEQVQTNKVEPKGDAQNTILSGMMSADNMCMMLQAEGSDFFSNVPGGFPVLMTGGNLEANTRWRQGKHIGDLMAR